MSLEIKSYSDGSFSAECYIVKDSVSGEAFIVDAGTFDNRLVRLIKEMSIEKFKYILLTHGHFDHIMGVKQLRDTFGGEIVIHKNDALCLTDSNASLGDYFGLKHEFVDADIIVTEGDSLDFANEKIKVMHTPGHTKGSVCYILGDVIFSGDTLFCSSMGRTDFPGGSNIEMAASLKRLRDMEGDYTVYPGHGESTTLDTERKTNPFMKGL